MKVKGFFRPPFLKAWLQERMPDGLPSGLGGHHMRQIFVLTVACLGLWGGQGAGIAPMGAILSPALAGDLVYTPINPSFGGSPLNSAHLLGLANAQRDATARGVNDGPDPSLDLGGTGTASDRNTDADLFVRQLQGRLLSALAGQVTEAIFGENPQDSGTVQFGATTVTFERTLGAITLSIVDATTGTVTDIVVPQLVSSN